MRRFPREFEALLSPRGRRVLQRGLPGEGFPPGARLLALKGLIAAERAAATHRLLERTFEDCLEVMDQPIPPESLLGMTENYAELLPKTVRNRTAFIDRPRSLARRRAQECGLEAMLRSESYRAFANVLSGRPLRRKWGTQLLSYGEGDYSGPHNDHHPEDPLARDGYFDLHLTFSGPDVAHQWLVWGQRGHFTGMERIDTRGGVTAYRLPFWHYTTPLAVRRPDARRWVVLGTFLYAPGG